jgi:uncharacterized membrane protein YgcG
MTRKLLTIRFGIRPPHFLLMVVLVVALALVQSASFAQPASTPPAGQPLSPKPAATPAPAADPDEAITATGNPNEDIQIGLSLDDFKSGKYENLQRVDDPQKILKLDQRIELADDAQRLTDHALPTIIVLRESTAPREESQAYADRLRIDRGVESSKGADDGMVMLVTFNPYFPRSSSIVFSFGQNALPKGGLTVASAEDVYQRAMLPRLKKNRLYNAIHVGIRQIIYLETYIPEAQPPLTDPERKLRGAVNVLGPLVLVGSAAGFVLTGRSPSRSRSSASRRRSVFVRTALIVGLGAALLFGLAVIAKSTIGVASAALVVLLLLSQPLIQRRPAGVAPAGVRLVSLPYRRTFVPARRLATRRTVPARYSRRSRG